MRYVIGIDGGGTKTHLAAYNERMELLYEGFGGSSGLTSSSSDAVREHLTLLLDRCFAESGLSPEECAWLCLGTAGGGRDTAKRELSAILQNAVRCWRITVTDDAASALSGATESGCGILLVSGTGSICFAKNAKGETARTGGWGHVAGDEGSGYDAACRTFRSVFRDLDGRGEPTLLTKLVLERLNATDADGIVDWLYRSGKGKSEIASIAALCSTACEHGDKAACSVIDECAKALSEMAVAAGRIFIGAEDPVPCVYTGGFLSGSKPLQERLRLCLEGSSPRMRLTAPLHNAAWGCAKLAWIDAGRTPAI